MPDSSLWLLLVIIVLAIGFGVVNGFNDAANAIAASIGSRALSPRNAIIVAVIFNIVGAATGLAVARTIGEGILVPQVISQFEYVPVMAALASVIIWGAIATRYGLPISLTHGFVAGLAAAGIALGSCDVGMELSFVTDSGGGSYGSGFGLCRWLCLDAYSILGMPAKSPG